MALKVKIPKEMAEEVTVAWLKELYELCLTQLSDKEMPKDEDEIFSLILAIRIILNQLLPKDELEEYHGLLNQKYLLSI